MDGIQEGKKSHVTLLQEVSESTPLKFLKHGAPLYRKITTLATATTFRPFQEKQLRRQRPGVPPGSSSSQLCPGLATLGIQNIQSWLPVLVYMFRPAAGGRPYLE